MVGKMHGMETQWVFKESSVSFHILSIHNTFYHFSTMLMGWSQVPVLSQQPVLFTGDTYFQRSTCQCRRWRRLRFDPWVGKILWRRKRQPTPVFLPGKSHGQSSLVGYSSGGGHKESDTTEYILLVKYIYAAAAAAKSLQSCPTLCDPIDGSPPGSAIPGILQARTLEWAGISFPSAWNEKWKWSRSVMSDS